MIYEDKPSNSAEFLRLALPLIAKYGLGANPVNYAVFYEYVAGTHPGLKQDLDALLHDPEAVTAKAMETLYLRHVSPCDAERMEEVRSKIGAMLDEVQGSVVQAGEETSRFGESLEGYQEQLAGEGAAEVSAVVARIAEDTQAARQATEALQAKLAESNREAAVLREQLSNARQEAVTDPLTGLKNRKGLSLAMKEILSQTPENPNPTCMLMMDIDHFKRVNDTYGHLLGDKVIKIVAKTIKDSVKGKDCAARYGGEEFAVVLPDTPLKGAYAVAESIRNAIARGTIKRTDNGEPIGRVTVSGGISIYRPGESSTDLIARADQALYASKEGGRNQVNIAEG